MLAAMSVRLPPDLASSNRVRRGVIGLLARGTDYLMIRRSPNVPKGGAWCFPGGHVDPGEISREAVVRELAEELGLVVRPTRRLGSIRILDSRHILVVWRVEHLSGEIRPHAPEVADVRWVPLHGIATITPGLQSNMVVLNMLRTVVE